MSATSDFYAKVSDSFSATRQHAWDGWRILWQHIAPLLPDSDEINPVRVLDVGCGNLRFERFLLEQADIPFSAHCIDNCLDLLEAGQALAIDSVDFNDVSSIGDTIDVNNAGADIVNPHNFGDSVASRHSINIECTDVLALLSEGCGNIDSNNTLSRTLGHASSNLCVAFGFMHHIPGFEMRVQFVQALVDATASGGLIALSFWQFACDKRLREKAERTTNVGITVLQIPKDELEENDYLLGWQENAAVFRYCHHFSENEIDALVTSLPAREIARFSADGKTGDLNRYVVLQKL